MKEEHLTLITCQINYRTYKVKKKKKKSGGRKEGSEGKEEGTKEAHNEFFSCFQYVSESLLPFSQRTLPQKEAMDVLTPQDNAPE